MNHYITALLFGAILIIAGSSVPYATAAEVSPVSRADRSAPALQPYELRERVGRDRRDGRDELRGDRVTVPTRPAAAPVTETPDTTDADGMPHSSTTPVNDEDILRADRSPAPVELSATDDTATYVAEVAAAIHDLTNRERVAAGLPALAEDAALAEVAAAHSADMAARDYFAHADPDGCALDCRLAAAGYDATAWGENIAWRSGAAIDAAALAEIFVKNWMESPGHRANILSDAFTHEGIGVEVVGGMVYATVTFADPAP